MPETKLEPVPIAQMGSLNLGPKDSIPNEDFTRLENFYHDDRARLVTAKTPGQMQTNDASGGVIVADLGAETHLFCASRYAGQPFRRVDEADFGSASPPNPALTMARSTVGSGRWSLAQLGDYVFAAREIDGLWKITKDFARPAGTPAPATASTIASGGSGDCEAGDYFASYSLVIDGDEGDLAPESNVLSLTAAGAITHTFPATLAGVVKRVYRTPNGQRGVYFRVGETTANTLTEDLTNDELGVSHDQEKAYPPPLRHICAWRERLWGHTGTVLYRSQPFVGSQWVPLGTEIRPEDGLDMTCLVPLSADRLVVGKKGSMHCIVADGQGGYRREDITLEYGCPGQWAACVVGGVLYWVSGRGLMRWAGGQPEAVDTTRIAPVLKAGRNISLVAYPSLSLLALWVDTDESFGARLLLYNYKLDRWSELRRYLPPTSDNFMGAADLYTLCAVSYSGGVHLIVCGDGEINSVLDNGIVGPETADVWPPPTLQTKRFSGPTRIGVRGLSIRITGSDGDADVSGRYMRVAVDQNKTPMPSKDIDLSGSDPMRQITVTGSNKASAWVSLVISLEDETWPRQTQDEATISYLEPTLVLTGKGHVSPGVL